MPLSSEQFASLRQFILENHEGDRVVELMKLCSRKHKGKAIEAIQAQNYVGVIELDDGLQIEILPKIEISSDSGKDRDKQFFYDMLSELGSSVSFKTLNRANLASKNLPLFEVFITMFLEEAATLVKKGLQSAYVDIEAQGHFVRGKIDFTKEARKNPAHAEVLNLRFGELRVDRPENRLVKTTLIKLKNRSHDAANVRRALQLLNAFDDVGISYNVDADLARCVRDRSTVAYDSLIAWCRVFLKGESFTMFRGENIVTALLFPMEKIFEDYVGKRLRREAIRRGALKRVELQAHTQWLFENNRVRLQPDILCTCDSGRRVVLDTKWKRIYGPNEISVADMYQMYAYGQRYCAEGDDLQHVLLLFPWHVEVTRGLSREYRHVSKDNVQVDVFFVDLSDMNTSMKELLELIGEPESLER